MAAIFTQALGGTPERRDDYPAIGAIKLSPGSPTSRMSDQDASAWSGVPSDGPPVILPGMDRILARRADQQDWRWRERRARQAFIYFGIRRSWR